MTAEPTPGHETLEPVFSRKTVRTMDAAPFLANAVRSSDFVAVKMDIEGHEYDVLRRILVTQPAALCNLGRPLRGVARMVAGPRTHDGAAEHHRGLQMVVARA